MKNDSAWFMFLIYFAIFSYYLKPVFKQKNKYTEKISNEWDIEIT
jgi:hypothetical protein